MHHKPTFIDWTISLADAVGSILVPDDAVPPFSLADTLVVVPTAQAGRRLRRALARRCAERGAGVLMGPVVTPFRLLEDPDGPAPVDPLEETAAWLDVLSPARCRNCPSLFPNLPEEIDFAWRRQASGLLNRIRRQLAEAGLTVADVAAMEDLPLMERRRWQDFERLEAVVADTLVATGAEDPVRAQIRLSGEAPPPRGMRRVVVACCPELAPVLQRLLGRWAETIEVQVLVHAPASLRAAFDAWGVPLADYWRRGVSIDLEHERVEIRVVNGPVDQAGAVREALVDGRAWSEKGHFAIGVPDPDVVAYTIGMLEQIDCPCFDPAGVPHRHHPVYRWLKAWRDLVAVRSYAALRSYLRLAAVGDFLRRRCDLDPDAVVSELDLLQNECLPETVEDVAAWIAHRPAFTSLAPVMHWLMAELRADDAASLGTVLRLLKEIHAGTTLVPGREQDDAFLAVARRLVDRLQRAGDIRSRHGGLSDPDWIDLLLAESETSFHYPEAGPRAVELEGWLELPWNDAPLMMITGMNEGFVPDGRLDDLFLPDSMRERLGLRCDATRFARDACLLTALTESRRTDGRLVLIAGRTSDRGDVLKPSRLFWRCSDEVLVTRAGAFFRADEKAVAVPERSFAIRLDPSPPDDLSRSNLRRPVWNVTDFKGYLNCPFQYYLERVLGMESIDDTKEEMDFFEFGKLVHHALEIWGKDEKLNHSGRADRVGNYLEELVTARVREIYGRRPPLTVELQARSAAQRLHAFAHRHAEDLRHGWRILEIEKKIILPFAGIELRGKIDRIDRNEKDGRIRVLDYKTSDKASSSPDKTHVRPPRDNDDRPYVAVELRKAGSDTTWLRHWSDLQLPLYLHALADEREDAPLLAGYVQLTKAVSDVAITVWHELDAAAVASAVTCAEGVIGDAAAGRFWPPLASKLPEEFEAMAWPGFVDQMDPPETGGRA